MMRFFKKLQADWCAETPILAKRIRNISATLATALPFAYSAFKATSIQIPVWFSYSVGIMIFICTLIAGISGIQRKDKDVKQY